MKIWLTLIIAMLCSISFLTKANDSALYGVGGDLVPIKETSIELRKEILEMSLNGTVMEVNVYFEFYNPEEETKTLTVGFITPPSHEWDMNNIEDLKDTNAHPQIEHFSVVINGEEEEFAFEILGETEFEFVKSKEQFKDGLDYVYHFTADFKPGLNTIEHHYTYGGGLTAGGPFWYPYKWTSGKMWANEQIDDFTLVLNMGTDNWFAIDDYVPHKKGWEVVGNGKFGKLNDNGYAWSDSVGFCFKGDGHIEFRTENFKPEKDFEISVYPNIYPYQLINNRLFYKAFFMEEEQLLELTKSELRIARNTFFAKYGYIFKDRKLYNLFNEYCWYFPDKSVTADNIPFTEKELARIALIKKIESGK